MIFSIETKNNIIKSAQTILSYKQRLIRRVVIINRSRDSVFFRRNNFQSNIIEFITLKEITNEDIMVIEDSIDTKQISIEDLQIFFSADNKITALKELLENELNKISDDLNNKITDLGDNDSDLIKRLEDLYEDHENTKKH